MKKLNLEIPYIPSEITDLTKISNNKATKLGQKLGLHWSVLDNFDYGDCYEFTWPKNIPIILPSHSYDLREANVSSKTVNLIANVLVNIIGGMSATIYEKTDNSKPAYIFLSNSEEGNVVITIP